MNLTASSIRAIAAGVALTCSASTALAQATGNPATPNASTPPVGETVELSPFVVSTSVEGYMASNTISGTAMNAPLREVPMTINVITSEFLEDALVGDFANAFDYNSSITQTNRQPRSEEHTSELQSRLHLVCRLLL